ncbi:RND family efflux transporter, MFP subunit [Spongiibacter sp. IMCC21906]|uniref:efflux RND transporter periplasmic adaptor subunit n=1 Tax=Spongiibacter sp. IMCC21906 TaxID=1620392 RepID=UPI00062DD3B4|nr:efflux RND transporter periplasmic adaptor subunit [Spongiibacter sp. IMCC21906]AKH70157.1 RND family efflux transporter, MFP subunit [Spongiibacter sp. IMCC21906]
MTDGIKRRQRRNIVICVLILLTLVGGTWYLLSASGGDTAPEPRRRGWGNMATSVSVVTAQKGSLDVQVHSIGTVTAMNTVIVRSRVGGVLDEILFDEGAEVKAGAPLAQIDPAPYQAQLAQAEGQLQQNRAQLENAKVDLELYQGLYKEDSIARQQLDSQAALVRQLQGANKSSQAEVDDARLQLSWTTITAPIAGRLGLRRVDAGNLITANEEEGLITITQTKPIAVFFTIPEVQVTALRKAMSVDDNLRVEVLSRNEQEVIATGKLVTLDNQIDVNTGTLRVKAEFANEDEALFPNQFVNVRLRLAEVKDVLTIAADAVQHGSQGNYVYVVEEGRAYIRSVELGAADDERVTITAGLSEGAQVVLEGLDRLRDGREVLVEGQETQPQPATESNSHAKGGATEPGARNRPAGQAANRPEGGRPRDGNRPARAAPQG